MHLPILLAAAAMLAPAPDWYRVAQTDNMSGYVDIDTIERNGQWTRARVTTIYTVVQSEGEKSATADMEIDCQAQTLRIARFAMYAPDRTELASAEWPEESKLYPIEAGTSFADLAAFICNDTRPGGVRVGDPYTDKS